MGEGRVDEDARRRFESGWREGNRPEIAQYLPSAEHPDYLPTLEELVLVDLELSWRSRGKGERAPLIEDYLTRFPDLEQPAILPRLLEEEYLVRSRHGDRPATDEYRERFPTVVPTGREVEGLVAADSETHSASGDCLGRFVLEGEHARGGFGLVWRARDARLGREVAVKQLAPRLAGEGRTRARFLAEARIAARLEHPGIVPVYELGEAGDGAPSEAPYYVMKLVRGRTLAAAIEGFHSSGQDAKGRQLERLRLLNAFLAVTRAVAYAHEHGVIHRDIKPENIVLGDFGETIILDWGVARTRRSGPGESAASVLDPQDEDSPVLTRAGTLIGTPAYMSPEQAESRLDEVDERSDIFSLGVVLYQLLTGRRPFEGADSAEVLELVSRGKAQALRTLDPSIPRPLEAICQRAMERQRERRYASAEQLTADLERFLGDAPVEAYHYGLLERLGRWARHHRPLVAGLLVGSILLAIAAVVGLLLWQGAERERERRLARLRKQVTAEEVAALAELRSDRPRLARQLLSKALEMTTAEPALHSLRPALERRLLQAEQLAQFASSFDGAWYRAGRDNTDPQARELARQGLEVLGVFHSERWWEHLPDDDLREGQRERLEQDALRLVLLHAVLLAMPALENPAGPAAREAAQAALQTLHRSTGFQPTQVRELLAGFCRFVLGEIELAEIEVGAVDNPIDHYFLGFIHFWLHKFSEDPASRIVRLLGPRIEGLDFEDPLGQAERHFRLAVQLEPERYWHHFMLGWVLEAARMPFEAELAFNSCIALRQDGYESYVARAEALMVQYREGRRPDILHRCLADIDEALRLAPSESHVRYTQALAYSNSGDHSRGLQAFVAGLLCDPWFFDVALGLNRRPIPADEKKAWKGWWDYAEKHVQKPGVSVAARLTQAHLDILLGELDRAQATARDLLEVEEAQQGARLVLAAVHLRRGELAQARQRFAEVHASTVPGRFLVEAGCARCLELSDRPAEARQAWEALRTAAATVWQAQEIERALERLAP